MTSGELRLGVDCPACEGRGEIQTARDYFGMPETVACERCDGRGQVNGDPWAVYCTHRPDVLCDNCTEQREAS